jgi:hypothetical protein
MTTLVPDNYGLANNIKALISAKNLYGNAKPDWVRWKYDNLFEPDPQLEEDLKSNTFYNFRFVFKELDYLDESFNLFYFPRDCKDGRCIDHMFSMVPQTIRNIIIDKLYDLSPNQRVMEKCAEFYKRHRYTMAVHYRTFNTDHFDKHDFNFDDSELFEILDQFPETDIFLATDNFEMGYAFTQRSKHRFHMFRDPTLDWQQNALADMLLLSKGALLFTPQFSTFSELSWYWGNCRQDVCNYRSSDFFQRSGQKFKTVWHRGTDHEKSNAATA